MSKYYNQYTRGRKHRNHKHLFLICEAKQNVSKMFIILIQNKIFIHKILSQEKTEKQEMISFLFFTDSYSKYS